jgi:hypothetical protein
MIIYAGLHNIPLTGFIILPHLFDFIPVIVEETHAFDKTV